MEQLIRKQGGSAIITLAPEYLEVLGLTVGSRVDVGVNNGALLIVPSVGRKTRALKYSMADLIGDFEGKLPKLDNWDDMPAVGRETPL